MEEIKFWVKENGLGAYCEGTPLPQETDIIFTTKKPGDSFYFWNIDQSIWETTVELKRKWIRPIRDLELARTDKYMLSDFWSSFTQQEQNELILYRQQLRDVPDHETVQEIVMPPCPPFIEP